MLLKKCSAKICIKYFLQKNLAKTLTFDIEYLKLFFK